MITFTSRPRVIRLSLPAETCSAPVLRKFVREVAQETALSPEEIVRLESAVTEAFNEALAEQKHSGEGRIALEINATSDEINVDVVYRETHFPPTEVFSRS